MEEEFFEREFENCGEVDIEIEYLENNTPDKRTKEYNEWKKKICFLFEKYNFLVKFTCFKPIK